MQTVYRLNADELNNQSEANKQRLLSAVQNVEQGNKLVAADEALFS